MKRALVSLLIALVVCAVAEPLVIRGTALLWDDVGICPWAGFPGSVQCQQET